MRLKAIWSERQVILAPSLVIRSSEVTDEKWLKVASMTSFWLKIYLIRIFPWRERRFRVWAATTASSRGSC